MGLWGGIKKGFKKATSWVGNRVRDIWDKVPDVDVDIGIKVDAKIRFDSADIRLGLEAVGKGLDTIGIGIQSGLGELGQGISGAGIALGQGVREAGLGVGEGLEAVGQGIHDFDITGGINRQIVSEFNAFRRRARMVAEFEHYLRTLGDPLAGDHLSLRFRNESDVTSALDVTAAFQLDSIPRFFEFEMNQSPKANDLLGWEQVITVPFSDFSDTQALPVIHWIHATATEPSMVIGAPREAAEPTIRVSVDVFRLSKGFEHYLGGGTFVHPKKRSSVVTAKQAKTAITVFPQFYNFGSIAVGSTARQFFSATNSGDTDVIIDTATVSPNTFTVNSPSLPRTMRTGESLTVEVAFTPTAPTTDIGRLEFAGRTNSANPPMPLVGVDIYGLGVAPFLAARPPRPGACSLQSPLDALATELVAVGCTQFDGAKANFYVELGTSPDTEIVLCASKDYGECPSGFVYILERGAIGTKAIPHPGPANGQSGARVRRHVPHQAFRSLAQQLPANQASGWVLFDPPSLGVVGSSEIIEVDGEELMLGVPPAGTVAPSPRHLWVAQRGVGRTQAAPHHVGSSVRRTAMRFGREEPVSDKLLESLLAETEQEVGKVLRKFGEKLIETVNDFWEFVGGKRKTDLKNLLEGIDLAEERAYDSNTLFLLRIGRVVTLDSLPLFTRAAPCVIRAEWTGTGGKQYEQELRSVVDGDAIIPIQRPTPDDGGAGRYRDWTRLEIAVSMTRRIAALATQLEFQVAQCFLSDLRIVQSRKGDWTDPSGNPDDSVEVFRSALRIESYKPKASK